MDETTQKFRIPDAAAHRDPDRTGYAWAASPDAQRQYRLLNAKITGVPSVVYGPKRREAAEAELQARIDTALELLPDEDEWQIAQRLVNSFGAGATDIAAYAVLVRIRKAERVA